MSRRNKFPLNPPAMHKVPVSAPKQGPPPRVPQAFVEAMKRISASDTNPNTQPKPKKEEQKPSAGMWKSSFQAADGKGGSSQERSTNSAERTQLYDPDSPLSSDSESEMLKTRHRKLSSELQETSVSRQRLSSDRHNSRHWVSRYSDPGSLPESRAYAPENKSLDRPGYGLKSGAPEQRGCGPDRVLHSSSTQLFPEPYRGRRSNGEERTTLPEYRRRQMTSTLGASPPRLKRDHPAAGLDKDPPPTKVARDTDKPVTVDRCPIVCDLCDVELANAQELEDHLDCKSHWNTLEHIQQNNKYDDLAVAFLQEVMLYKSRHCSRAVEDKALQALQEKDHLTKVEMFHCAACKVYISTSAADVHAHVTSQGHLSNTKEFEAQQRHTCLHKAATMLKELSPQFKLFLKGGSPFE